MQLLEEFPQYALAFIEILKLFACTEGGFIYQLEVAAWFARLDKMCRDSISSLNSRKSGRPKIVMIK
jgi:hypothetical protein